MLVRASGVRTIPYSFHLGLPLGLFVCAHATAASEMAGSSQGTFASTLSAGLPGIPFWGAAVLLGISAASVLFGAWIGWRCSALRSRSGPVPGRVGRSESVSNAKRKTGHLSFEDECNAAERARTCREIFEMESDAIFLIENETGRILEANTAASALYGYSYEELVAKRNVDLSAEPDQTRAATSQRLNVVPIRYHRKKSGEVFPVEIAARHFAWHGREVHVAAVRDITKRLRSEEEAERQRTFLRSVIDADPSFISVRDAEGRFVLVNLRMAHELGKTTEECIGKTVLEIIPDARLARAMHEDDLAMLRGEESGFEGEEQFIGRDGRPLWLYTLKQPMRNRAGEIVSIIEIGADVTERNAAIQALEESRKSYRDLYENALVGLLRSSIEEGRVLECNQRLVEMLGYSDRETFMREFRFPEHYAEPHGRERFLDYILAEGIVRDYDVELVRRDGSHMWARHGARAFPARGYIEGYVIDITEQKRAEDALRETRELFSTFMDQLPAAALIKDQDGRVQYVNQYTRDNFNAENWIGRPLEECFPAQVAATMSADDRAALSAGAVQRIEALSDKNGSARLWHTYKFPIRREGKPPLLGGISLDISARIKAEETLRRLATAVEQAAEAIIITDIHGVIEYVNPAFGRITGYSAAEAVGNTPRLLKSGKHDRVFYEDLWHTLENGEVWSGRFSNRKRDGTLFEGEATISPIRDTGGKIVGFVGVERDITEEVRLESRLRQSQKMEAVGQLAGGIAHDFNNLLQGIQGYTQLAMERLDPDEPGHANLEEVMKAADRAAELTRQLSTFSRRQALQAKDIDLNQIISDMMKMLRRVIGEHIALDVVPGYNLPLVTADPGQIGQVLLNLCVNARDAMPAGGRIVIKTERVQIDRTLSESRPWAKEGEYLLLTVADNGEGIPPEIRERVFEPFFSTKDVGKGTGLGLATVYGIVKQHQGIVTVDSEPGAGATFSVYLPVSTGALVDDELESEPEPVPGGTETVLLAEDEEMVCKLAETVLRNAGYRVLVARDGEEAVDLFKQHASEITLAILDIIMPKLSGRAVHQHILEVRQDLPVLFSSGYSLDADDDNGPSKAPIRMIQKPYKPDVFLRTVRDFIDEAGEKRPPRP